MNFLSELLNDIQLIIIILKKPLKTYKKIHFRQLFLAILHQIDRPEKVNQLGHFNPLEVYQLGSDLRQARPVPS